MKISDFDTVTPAEKGSFMQVETVEGEETEARIKLAGYDSTIFRKSRHFHHSRMAEEKKTGVLGYGDAEEVLLKSIAESTLAWEGIDEDCTPENAEKLYRMAPAVFAQANAHMKDRSNYLGKSSSSSANSQSKDSS